MTATFDESILPGDITALDVENCKKLDYSKNSQGNEITTKFETCANITTTDDLITQEAIVRVQNSVYPNNNKSLGVQRVAIYYYRIQCIFNRKLNVTLSVAVLVEDRTEEYAQTKTTVFEATMRLYKTSNFLLPVDGPLSVVAWQPIYMQIKGVYQPKLFKFVTEKCWASPDENPTPQTKQYLFFDRKCAIDSTFKEYNPGSTNKFDFSIKAFTFLQIKQVVWFHCNLLVCDKSSTEDACQQKCSTKPGPVKDQLERREVVEHRGVVDRIDVKSNAVYFKRSMSLDQKIQHVKDEIQLVMKEVKALV